MTRSVFSCAALAAIAALLLPPDALAATKVWVADTGIDTVTCGDVSTPCATFQQAHNNVAAGGEVGVLTPGDYGVVTISKSVHITNDGTGEAGIQVASGTGILVSAGAGDVVSVRGLVIDGQIVGRFGIRLSAATALHVQNCVIRNFQTGTLASALWINPPGTSQLFVSDTIVFNNGNSGLTGGVFIQPPGAGSLNAVLDRVTMENNVKGLIVDSTASTSGNGIHLVMRDSVSSGNVSDGILVLSGASGIQSFVFIDGSSVVNNFGNGILANGSRALVLLGASHITRNGAGVATVAGGRVFSYGDNENNNNIGAEGVASSMLAPF